MDLNLIGSHCIRLVTRLYDPKSKSKYPNRKALDPPKPSFEWLAVAAENGPF